MKPTTFKQVNNEISKNQPEYHMLPVYTGDAPEHEAISRWELSQEEKEKILSTGVLWIRQLTYSQRFQPILPTVDDPFTEGGN